MTEDCHWVQDSDWENSGDYYTSCGEAFSLCEGTPEENGLRFCCYCGKELIQILTEEEEENG